MGLSLQHHLTALFIASKLRFSAQARTEGKNRPDFLFPGEAEYHDEIFNAEHLVMLGAKSTLKERWRQILVEANRIQRKHLCTLEPGISRDQTEEMHRHEVTLVIPKSLHATYNVEQAKTIWDVTQFLNFVKVKQTL